MTDKKESPANELNPSDDKTTTATPEATSNESSSTNGTDNSAIKQPISNEIKKPSNGKALSGLAIVVGIAAISLSGWQFYQNEFANHATQALSQAQNKIIALEQQITRVERTTQNNAENARKLSSVPSDIEALSNRYEQSKTESEQAFIDLSSKINQLSNVNQDDWLLAEAEYLIRLANQRLLLERDTQSATSLLINADEILGSLKDPLMFDTRKAIAQDVQALKSTSHFDLEGRYLQLSALYDQVTQLPQREPSQSWQAKQSAQTSESNNLSSIKMIASEAWEGLKSLVVINYNQKPIEPLLPPSEYQQLVTGIQLQIDVAQVALLKGEQAIYDKALSRIAAATNAHFDTQANSTRAFMTTLTSLQQVNPNPNIPMPRASLKAMRELMQSWNQQSSPMAPNAQSNTNEEESLSPSTATEETL